MNPRLRLSAVLLALVATLAGQALVAHGHGGASDQPEPVVAASEDLHEAAECAACVARANRHGELAAPAVPVVLPRQRRISPPASEPGAAVAPSSGMPPERAPPHSA